MAHRTDAPNGGGRSAQDADEVAEARPVHRLIRSMSSL
jgi:hypothetical protein